MAVYTRQLDIIAHNPQFGTLPAWLPGRTTAEDFVYFHWPPNINPLGYTVVVESIDNAGGTYRSIGKLDKQVKLPAVKLAPHSLLGVLPLFGNQPAFYSELIKGGTYVLPHVTRNGRYKMEAHGVY
jgi:hypothetical protein